MTRALVTTKYSSSGVLGKTDGVAVAAGLVGEKISASITANTSTAGTTGLNAEVDITGASITLAPGNWLLYYFGTVFQQIDASAGNAAYSRVRITTSANVHVPRSSTVTSNPYNATSTAWYHYKFHTNSVTIDVPSTTTYKLRLQAQFDGTSGQCRFQGVSTSGSLVGFTDVDAESAFYAIRIA